MSCFFRRPYNVGILSKVYYHEWMRKSNPGYFCTFYRTNDHFPSFGLKEKREEIQGKVVFISIVSRFMFSRHVAQLASNIRNFPALL